MKTKKFQFTKKRLILLSILALLVIAALIYTRPMTVEQLVGLNLDRSVAITAEYRIGRAPPSDSDEPLFTELTLTPEDPEFEQLLALFQGRTFRRTLGNLLPQAKVRTYAPTEKEFWWELTFCSDTPIEFPDGSIAKSALLHVDNFYGLLEINGLGNTLRCTTQHKNAWLAEVVNVLSAASE